MFSNPLNLRPLQNVSLLSSHVTFYYISRVAVLAIFQGCSWHGTNKWDNEKLMSSARSAYFAAFYIELYLVSYSNPTCSPNPFIEQGEQLGNVKKTALPHLCLVCNVHFLNDVTAMRTIVLTNFLTQSNGRRTMTSWLKFDAWRHRHRRRAELR